MSGIREELEAMYTKVRNAMATYDLDAARPHLDVPPDQPDPSREDAARMAEMMPDISKGRFLIMQSAPGRMGLYYETNLEDESSSEVTVIRFEERGDVWGLARNTFNSASTDKASPAQLLGRIHSDPSLAL